MERLARFNMNPPATEEEIAGAERELGVCLPADYRAFLLRANGGEGFIGFPYVILFGIGQVPELNIGYEVNEYVPGYLLFGSNGGGEAFGFDRRNGGWEVMMIPFVPLEWEYARPVGNSFGAFMETLLASRGILARSQRT